MRFRTAGAIGHDVERQFLTFRDLIQTRFLNRRDMNENILFVFRGFDESVTFFVIKPLNCSTKHVSSFF